METSGLTGEKDSMRMWNISSDTDTSTFFESQSEEELITWCVLVIYVDLMTRRFC
jgi:hypothetical protein